ncbi:MAG TPA: SPFH domain-containing protein [Gemmatimonadales bacterium]
MFREIKRDPMSGYVAILLLLVTSVGTGFWLVSTVRSQNTTLIVVSALAGVILSILWAGFFMVHPNEARVLQLFGKYAGTVRTPGLQWANPFYTKAKVSVRVRNFETTKLKVNDLNSNPIEVASVVVWKVVDTAEAMFEVDDYNEYVHVQSESALRTTVTAYPYDAFEEGQLSLSRNMMEIAEKLKADVQDRLAKAGVEVIEARISHLAYAPEIASAMLQRQQASAIIAARQKIVEGAVGMVEMALDHLARKHVVELDAERKAAMVSNLLVVLCADRNPQPVVNAGSLY